MQISTLLYLLQFLALPLVAFAAPIFERAGAAQFPIKTSKNKADWTPEATIKKIAVSPPNKAMFWSGKVGTQFVADLAEDFALKNGLVTLEILLSKAGAVMPEFDLKDPATVSAWKDASRFFAEGASGTVKAFVGRPLRTNPSTVYESVELVALKKNPNVVSVTELNAADPTNASKNVVVFSKGGKSKLREVQEEEDLALSKRAAATAQKAPVAKAATKPAAKPVAKKPTTAAAKKPVTAAKKPTTAAAAKKPVAAKGAGIQPGVAPAAGCSTSIVRCDS